MTGHFTKVHSREALGLWVFSFHIGTLRAYGDARNCMVSIGLADMGMIVCSGSFSTRPSGFLGYELEVHSFQEIPTIS
jgi:hypothetical protein